MIFPEYYYRESKTVFSNESHIIENKFADFRRHPKTRSCQKITETAATQKQTFLNRSQCLHRKFSQLKKDIEKRFSRFETIYKGKLRFGKWAKSDQKKQWQIVANEMSSKILSEWITQQKRIEILFNGRYLYGLTSLEIWIDYIVSLWRTKKKSPKNA